MSANIALRLSMVASAAGMSTCPSPSRAQLTGPCPTDIINAVICCAWEQTENILGSPAVKDIGLAFDLAEEEAHLATIVTCRHVVTGNETTGNETCEQKWSEHDLLGPIVSSAFWNTALIEHIYVAMVCAADCRNTAAGQDMMNNLCGALPVVPKPGDPQSIYTCLQESSDTSADVSSTTEALTELTAAPTAVPTTAHAPGAIVHALMTQDHEVGDTEIFVDSTTGFAVGNIIWISGGGHSEQRLVVGIGSIFLEEGLENSYPSGSSVSVVPHAINAKEEAVASTTVVLIVAAVVLVLAFVVRAVLVLRHRRATQARANGKKVDEEQPPEQLSSRLSDTITWDDLSEDEQDILGRFGFESEQHEGKPKPRGCIVRGPNCCLADEDCHLVKTDPKSWCATTKEELQRQIAKLTEQKHSRAFWFLPREKILELPEDCPVPRHQELRDSGFLVKRMVSWDDVFSGKLAEDTAAASHRWFDVKHPDEQCVKLKKMKEVLRKNPHIQFVWLDFMCAPQFHGGGRTLAEVAEFQVTLDAILPYMFLGATVVIFYETQYMGRFWPSVESWISTKTATSAGLQPSKTSDASELNRVIVVGVQSSEDEDVQSQRMIRKRWHDLNASGAIDKLSKDDIAVTNQSDKTNNLKLLAKLDDAVIEYFAEKAS